MLLLPSAFPQSHNLVTSTVPRIPFTDTAALAGAVPGEVLQTVTSYDGLGRVTQKVQVAASPGKKDLVTAYAYDLAGRREKEYLPYVREEGGKGHIATDPLEELRSFYRRPHAGIDTTTFPYARKLFDGSPLNRVLQEGAPGRPWQPERGHAVTFNNTVNLQPVTRWQVGKDGSCTPAGSYAPGSLLVKEVRDEDGHLSREYTDKRGRVILKETLLDSVPVQTFYVYDDRDLLRVVIPPMAAALGKADDRYAFRYAYDDRRRMITKKIPGAETVEMVYDNMNRLVMSRDGNLRRDTLWRYTFYDAFGRVTQQGLCKTASGREALQGIFDRKTSGPGTAPRLPGTLIPQQYAFYDDYAFLTDTALSFYDGDLADEDPAVYSEPPERWERSDKTKGKQTGSRVLVPVTGEWLESVTYYDDLGRAIQTVRRNRLGGIDRTSTLYAFSGSVLKTVTTHTAGYGMRHIIVHRFDYDHAGRLLRVRYRMDSLPEVILSENVYDELGRVMKKKLHGTAAGTFAQEIDYHYNIRGWLQRINDPDSLGDDLFAEALSYEDPAGYDADSLFSGNISVMRWCTPSLGGSVAYAFGYDGLGRLVRASWHKAQEGKGGGDYSVPVIAYDLNGNIDTLVRRGEAPEAGGVIDALGYKYDGNRLIAVDDATERDAVTPGFSDHGAKYDRNGAGADTLPEYRYDANGNMVSDANKGILKIRYDRNNLPEEILFDHDRRIRYLYDANGTKLRKEVYGQGGHLLSVTDYDGDFVYQDGEPAYVITGEGRLVYNDEQNTWQWEYYLKDHLGNVRTAFRPDSAGRPVVLQENHYYPFGMSIATLSHTLPAQPYPNLYQYNGKELQPDNELNWYDYGARYYDPSLGRWNVPDPLAEKYFSYSQYNYVGGNPILLIDLFGMDWYYNDSIGYKWFDSDKKNYTDDEGNEFVNKGHTHSVEIGGVWYNFYQNQAIGSTKKINNLAEFIYQHHNLVTSFNKKLSKKYSFELYMDALATTNNKTAKEVLSGVFLFPSTLIGGIEVALVGSAAVPPVVDVVNELGILSTTLSKKFINAANYSIKFYKNESYIYHSWLYTTTTGQLLLSYLFAEAPPGFTPGFPVSREIGNFTQIVHNIKEIIKVSHLLSNHKTSTNYN